MATEEITITKEKIQAAGKLAKSIMNVCERAGASSEMFTFAVVLLAIAERRSFTGRFDAFDEFMKTVPEKERYVL